MRNSPPHIRSLRIRNLIISLATLHLRMMKSQVLLRLMHPPYAMIFLIWLAPLLALIILLHPAHPFAMSFLHARENNGLKQEVEKLKEDLVKVKKSKVKPSQDNVLPMKKLEKRSTVTCSICHESGHKSDGCKLRRKKKEEKATTIASTMKAKEKRKMTRKTSISDTHTKKINEATPYLLKKNHDGKVIAYKIGVEDKHWNQPIWVPKDIIINMKGPKKVWVPKKP